MNGPRSLGGRLVVAPVFMTVAGRAARAQASVASGLGVTMTLLRSPERLQAPTPAGLAALSVGRIIRE